MNLLTDSSISDDSNIKDLILNDKVDRDFQNFNQGEHSFCSRENMEGYTSLVNLFLRSICMNSRYPCVINVDDIEDKSQSKEAQAQYQAQLQFKDSFTTNLRKIRNIQSINVKVDFSKLPKGGIDRWAARRLCGNTFSYMGLQD